MSLVCAQCSRVNPSDAAYCYFDGAALAGRAGGPINAGSAPFPNQFVFPNGLACRNFDQLATACQQHWSAAIDLLKQGYLGSFFGGMGRIDLAAAAQEAAKFPDLDRGLDQLLSKIPSQAVQPPKLQAEPSVINLGVIKVGENRTSELHLTNLGMRLLYGTVTSDCKWLTIGEGAGHAEKMVQFGSEAIVPIQVRGQHLRAGTKPLEGHLTIDSNGGTVTVTFKADVPIVAYEGGLFAGAVTPRQVAEKAKAKPKDAAPYFEKGDVAAWYAANGWAYPVQGPIMSGMGSIQQFFEALGVAKAPKVSFSPKSLDLSGAVGKTVETAIEVSTAEKKVVYGWATCDKTWLEVGKTKLGGKTASIPITINIPKPCPPTLETTLNVVGNGNQKVAIPLKVAVAGGKAGVKLEEDFVTLEVVEEDDAPVNLEVIDDEPMVAVAADEPVMSIPHATSAPASSVAFQEEQIPTAASAAADDDTFGFGDPSARSRSFDSSVKAGEPPVGGGGGGSKTKLPPPQVAAMRIIVNLIPLVALFLCLLPSLVGYDAIWGPKVKPVSVIEDDDDVDRKHPLVKIEFDEGTKRGPDYHDTMNFAVHKIDPKGKLPSVKLNWYENGFGNSIVAQINGKDAVFGEAPLSGKWYRDKKVDYTTGGLPAGKYGGKKRTFDFQKEGIRITQTVTIEPGDPVEVAPGEYKRLLNTCLVRYQIFNATNETQRVGLRVLMDTCIGQNDGTPFTLPGVAELVTTSKEFLKPEVPDFVQVLEKPDLKNPGIVLQLNLRVSDKFEAPDRFLLTRYPGREAKAHNKWNIPVKDMGDDSSVVIYWDPKDIEKRGTRDLGFTYGLGDLSVEKGKLAVTVGGSSYVGGELTVVALVSDREAKYATLKLPPGLALVAGGKLRQPVPPVRDNRPSPVTWRVRAADAGKHVITVSTDKGVEAEILNAASRRITITAKSLFN
ncbi:MAG TPA: hypothetical protein VFE62_06985 [Gemmataceae bacterium]|nr:hypothetical protein [Gemmataceae bacterium]